LVRISQAFDADDKAQEENKERLYLDGDSFDVDYRIEIADYTLFVRRIEKFILKPSEPFGLDKVIAIGLRGEPKPLSDLKEYVSKAMLPRNRAGADARERSAAIKSATQLYKTYIKTYVEGNGAKALEDKLCAKIPRPLKPYLDYYIQDIYYYCAKTFFTAEQHNQALQSCLALLKRYPESWHVRDAAQIVVKCPEYLTSNSSFCDTITTFLANPKSQLDQDDPLRKKLVGRCDEFKKRSKFIEDFLLPHDHGTAELLGLVTVKDHDAIAFVGYKTTEKPYSLRKDVVYVIFYGEPTELNSLKRHSDNEKEVEAAMSLYKEYVSPTKEQALQKLRGVSDERGQRKDLVLQDIYYYSADALQQAKPNEAVECCLRLLEDYPDSWRIGAALKVLVPCESTMAVKQAERYYNAMPRAKPSIDQAVKDDRELGQLQEKIDALFIKCQGMVQEQKTLAEIKKKGPLNTIERSLWERVKKLPRTKISADQDRLAVSGPDKTDGDCERLKFYNDLDRGLSDMESVFDDINKYRGREAELRAAEDKVKKYDRLQGDFNLTSGSLNAAEVNLALARSATTSLTANVKELRTDLATTRAKLDDATAKTRDFALVVLVDADFDMERMLGSSDSSRQILSRILEQVLLMNQDIPCKSLLIAAASEKNQQTANLYLRANLDISSGTVNYSAGGKEHLPLDAVKKLLDDFENQWATTQIDQPKALRQGLALCDMDCPHRMVYITTRKSAFCGSKQSPETVVGKLSKEALQRKTSISCIQLSDGTGRRIKEITWLADETGGIYANVFVDSTALPDPPGSVKGERHSDPHAIYQRELLRAVYDALGVPREKQDNAIKAKRGARS